ncbi:MAG TPA: PorP/SprF family type IX secretion system membrane protein [Bacteroidales bacterium]|nr:PorP/SprF family type IX secretion system membrane protein [Bacteroidales bacterium]
MDKNNQIDELFREKLGNYQPEYVPEHWQMMKSAIANPRVMNYKSNRLSIANIIMILSAILIVTSGIVTYVVSERTRQENVSEQQMAINTQPVNKISEQTANNVKSFNEDKNLTADKNLNENKSITNNHPVNSEKINQKNNAANNVNNNTIKSANNQDNVVKTNRNAFEKKNTAAVIDKKLAKKSEPIKTASAQTDKKSVESIVTNNKNEIINNVKAEDNFVNGVKVDHKVINSDEEIVISSKSGITDKEKFMAGSSESELNNPVISENVDYSSVIDDYNADKNKAEGNKKQNRKSSSSKKKNLEAAPDYKVGVVNNTAVNPAYAGFNQHHTINVSTMVNKPLYKPGNDFNVPFEYSFAYDFNFGKRKNCGVGLDYTRFIGAAEGTKVVNLTFAYRFNLAKYHNLRVGASLSYYSSDLNKNDLSFPDMIDENHGFVFGTSEAIPDKTTKNKFDMGFGVWYSWRSLYVGVSAIHLTSPDIGVIGSNNLPREYLLKSGYNYAINDNYSMLSAVELRYNEKTFNFTPSVLFTFNKWLLFGTEFRNLRDAGVVLGFNMKDNVIINIHSGVPMNRILMNNFGIIDYAAISVRLQF